MSPFGGSTNPFGAAASLSKHAQSAWPGQATGMSAGVLGLASRGSGPRPASAVRTEAAGSSAGLQGGKLGLASGASGGAGDTRSAMILRTMGEPPVPRLLEGEQLVVMPVAANFPVAPPPSGAQPVVRAARGAFAGVLKG